MPVDKSFVEPNRFVDSDHPTVIAFAEEHAAGATGKRAAVRLYYAVRDGFRYNPWRVRVSPADFTASGVLLRDPDEGAHCIDKALLLAGAARAVAIPSRLHFANVKNHIGTGELEKRLGTNLLVYHGYTELHLEGRWVAATPAFNRELCERLGVAPLEFDGETDSIFQEYDHAKGRFMEYVADHGVHAGLPFEDMIAEWRHHYVSIRERGAWPDR